MKLRLLTLLTCLALSAPAAAERIERGNLVTENVPDTPVEVRNRLLQYQNTRSARLGGWQSDGGGLYVVTGFGETPQVHHVEAPGGARHQLTFYDEPVGSLAPSPADPNVFAFSKDKGGDENYQIFLFDQEAGVATLMSDGEDRKGAPLWSRNGEQLAWYTTLEGATRGIVVAPADAPETRKTIFTNEGWWAAADWSPDGSTILLFHYVSITQSELWLLDVESGEASQINPSSEHISYDDAAFSHDGRSVYYTSDEDGEFRSLYRLDLASGEKENLTSDIAWNVGSVELGPKGKTYTFVVNEAGRSRLHIRNVSRDREIAAPDLPPGVIYGIEYSRDGKQLGFTMNTATAPADVYSWPVSGRGRELARWTMSEVGGLDPAGFIEPEFFDYETFDEVDGAPREIPAFIYRPEGEGPHPVIISIHGGPEGQARPTFSSLNQFWAKELGMAVIRPNVRGSAGFGKTYVKLDNGMKREDSVKDIGALLDWVAEQPDLDAEQVIVYGGSYGGYMVLASLVHYDEKLAGAVNIVGISNFVTFLENTADYRRDLRRQEYGDERDPEMRAFLESISPLNHVDKITTPILIIQGLNDPRVPASESEQILAAVRANGGNAWYMLAKDEGHGFRKKSNRNAMSEAVVLFLEDVLGLEVAPAPVEASVE